MAAAPGHAPSWRPPEPLTAGHGPCDFDAVPATSPGSGAALPRRQPGHGERRVPHPWPGRWSSGSLARPAKPGRVEVVWPCRASRAHLIPAGRANLHRHHRPRTSETNPHRYARVANATRRNTAKPPALIIGARIAFAPRGTDRAVPHCDRAGVAGQAPVTVRPECLRSDFARSRVLMLLRKASLVACPPGHGRTARAGCTMATNARGREVHVRPVGGPVGRARRSSRRRANCSG